MTPNLLLSQITIGAKTQIQGKVIWEGKGTMFDRNYQKHINKSETSTHITFINTSIYNKILNY